jgi:hypothetical protein
VKRCEEGREGSGVMVSWTPQCRYLTNILSEDTVEEKVGNSKGKDTGKCKRAGQEHAVAIKCERKTGQNMS